MNKQNYVVLATLTVALLAIPSILATALRWPLWAWLVVVIAAMVVPVVVAGRFRERASQEQRMQELWSQQAAAREE